MKYFSSLRFLLSALMLCLTISVQAGEVTFNGATDTNGKADAGADQLTKNGVTLSVSNGYLASGDGQYRTYKGQTLTISSTVGAITKVVFTCTANDDTKYGPGCFTVATGNYTYEGNTGTWTGAANEVVFTAEHNAVRATEILVTVDGDVPVDPDPVGPDPDPEPSATYTSIAGMKAASTADKTDVKYQFKDLLVTYVNGVYNYVSDGTDGFLFYGTSELVAGDKITGSVTGKLYQYNVLNEMAENSFTIDSKTSGNAVVIQDVPVASILSDYRNYESEYVRISDVIFNGAFANGVTVSQNGSDMVLYNRFKLNYEVNTDHKYDIYGFPAIFKETIQLYVTEIVDKGDADYHRLILTANEGGTITYQGKTIKNSSATFDIVEGNSATITVEPYEKYKLVSLKMNGINVKKYMEGNTFTTDEIDGDVEIVATFDLIDPYITITPTNQLQTFCSDENLNFSEVNGLTAYIVVGFKPSAKELLLTPVIEVPAGTGVLLKGEVGKTYKVPTLDASDYNYSNALVGVLEDEEVTTGFVFDETFKAVDGSAVVPSNTAYLLIPAATEAGISELKGYLTDGPAVKGDLNGDGMADISDVVYLVNLILGQ